MRRLVSIATIVFRLLRLASSLGLAISSGTQTQRRIKMKIPTRVVLVLVVLAALGSSVSAQAVTGQIPVWDGTNLIGDSVITQNSDGSLTVNVASTGSAFFVGNSATSGSTNGLFGADASPDGNGVLGVNNATSGFAVGVTGFTFSPAGAGLNGFSASTSGGIGVIGTSPASGTGVIGQNQVCSGGSCTKVAGTAGAFVTGAGGTILVGQVGDQNQNVFRVDDTGKGFFDGGTQTGGADFAESVAIATSANRYGPGDLLIVDTTADRQLTLATEPYSTLVAGIYSTKPGVLATAHKMDAIPPVGEIPLAIVGIVPCKVSAENGPIQRGDLLVTSSTPGYAMKGTDRNRMLGAVVGKAMEPLENGTGVIQVLVTLQ
jgi:trimeric autotransporter adhesin